jgi:uncharacterized repeat protein (TIGR02543 family)
MKIRKALVLILCAVLIALLTAPLHASAAELSLTTTYAGGNGQCGIMFDIVAKSDVLITRFDTNVDADSGDTVTIRIYGKEGTFADSYGDPSAWTILGTSDVVAAGPDVPTPLPIVVDVSIPAGSTYAFLITTVGNHGALNYTNGEGIGSLVVQDDHIQILEGMGVAYDFGDFFGDEEQGRIFNGTVYYELEGIFDVAVVAGAGGTVSGGGAFDAGATVSGITAKPNAGYHFTGWTAQGVTLSDPTANPLSFAMPQNDVTLTATFAKDAPVDPGVPDDNDNLPATGDAIGMLGIVYLASGMSLTMLTTRTLRKKR